MSGSRPSPCRVRGVVVRGDGLGRRLGFPTANVSFGRQGLPPRGVYRVSVSGPGLGRKRPAVCNVGVRPTLKGPPRLQVEVHIPGFSADLYGKRLTVSFGEMIRPERKFPSLAALKSQIRRDVRTVRP